MSKRIFLVKFDLDTPLFLTNFHRDFTYDGNTYIKGKMAVDAPIKQTSQPNANSFDVTLSAVDKTLISVFTSQPYKNRECEVLRAYIDEEDESLISVESWVTGTLEKYTYTGSVNGANLKIKVSSIFGAFDTVTSVDLGVLYAEYISVDNTIYWGQEAGAASGSGSGSGGPFGEPIDEVEID